MGIQCQKTHSPFVSQHTDTVTHTRQRATAGMAGSHTHMPTPAWAHTNHSSSVAQSLSGLGDLTELWLTLIGLLHHTDSHLDAYWLADCNPGSRLTGGRREEKRIKRWKKVKKRRQKRRQKRRRTTNKINTTKISESGEEEKKMHTSLW